MTKILCKLCFGLAFAAAFHRLTNYVNYSIINFVEADRISIFLTCIFGFSLIITELETKILLNFIIDLREAQNCCHFSMDFHKIFCHFLFDKST